MNTDIVHHVFLDKARKRPLRPIKIYPFKHVSHGDLCFNGSPRQKSRFYGGLKDSKCGFDRNCGFSRNIGKVALMWKSHSISWRKQRIDELKPFQCDCFTTDWPHFKSIIGSFRLLNIFAKKIRTIPIIHKDFGINS